MAGMTWMVAPGPTGLARLAGARPEVDPARIEVVACHRLTEDAEVRILFRQAAVAADPVIAAVMRPPHRRMPVGHEAARIGRRERDVPDSERVARVGDHRE